MADISAFDGVWGMEAKKAVFDAWDPSAKRTYDNFNPFERDVRLHEPNCALLRVPFPAAAFLLARMLTLSRWTLLCSQDVGGMCDTNGVFPGAQGYKSPTRPDVSWAQMQEQAAEMKAMESDAKFNIKGQPGCWHMKWQDGLGAPP